MSKKHEGSFFAALAPLSTKKGAALLAALEADNDAAFPPGVHTMTTHTPEIAGSFAAKPVKPMLTVSFHPKHTASKPDTSHTFDSVTEFEGYVRGKLAANGCDVSGFDLKLDDTSSTAGGGGVGWRAVWVIPCADANGAPAETTVDRFYLDDATIPAYSKAWGRRIVSSLLRRRKVAMDDASSQRFKTHDELTAYVVKKLAELGYEFPCLSLQELDSRALTVVFDFAPADPCAPSVIRDVALRPSCPALSKAAGRWVVDTLVKKHGNDPRVRLASDDENVEEPEDDDAEGDEGDEGDDNESDGAVV